MVYTYATEFTRSPPIVMTDTPNVPPPVPEKREGWERGVLEHLAMESLRERRRARRWGIFFKLFFAAYLVALFVAFQADRIKPIAGKHTALIDIEGVIAQDGEVDADAVISGLREAFKQKDAVGVILRINSPGGSPVQAGYVNDEIVRLREANPDVPVYAVIGDICASGGYYIAAAADKIYADKASIVGSIGVLMDGFGFVDGMRKLGIERRLLTAGKNKGILDPFSPLDPRAREHAQRMLDQIHRQFIAKVKEGRGDRLAKNPDIFSGLFWTGEEARQLGLVDEFGSAGFVAREVLGAEEIVDYTPRHDLLNRFAQRLGMAMARTLGTDLLGGRIGLR